MAIQEVSAILYIYALGTCMWRIFPVTLVTHYWCQLAVAENYLFFGIEWSYLTVRVQHVVAICIFKSTHQFNHD